MSSLPLVLSAYFHLDATELVFFTSEEVGFFHSFLYSMDSIHRSEIFHHTLNLGLLVCVIFVIVLKCFYISTCIHIMLCFLPIT